MGAPVGLVLTAVLGMAMAAVGRAEEGKFRNVVLPGTDIAVPVGANLLNRDGGGPRADLVLELQAWLSAELAVPTVVTLPRFVFATPRQLYRMRLRPVAGGFRHAIGDAVSGEVIAFYEDTTGTIYLPRGWTGGTPAELSILVHELVHHVQSVSGVRYACAEEMETAAFDAQDRLLALYGTDLERAFGIDPFTRLARGLCLPS